MFIMFLYVVFPCNKSLCQPEWCTDIKFLLYIIYYIHRNGLTPRTEGMFSFNMFKCNELPRNYTKMNESAVQVKT